MTLPNIPVHVPRRIEDSGPTQRVIKDISATQSRVDPTVVAQGLGAEPVGTPSVFPGLTFAMLRERVAALLTNPRVNAGPGEPLDFSPEIRMRLQRLTEVMRADGLSATTPDVAEALMSLSLETVDRAALAAKLRERANRAGAQPS